MANESGGSIYEDARKQRLLENKKRFEDLGLVKLSKNLSDVTKSEKSKSQNQHVRRKPTDNHVMEPRRSSRARNQVTSYCDEFYVERSPSRKRSRSDSSWASYLARPIEEVKAATYEERARAYKCAEKLQSNLGAGNPSFVKSMVRSHVYSCFWLALPGPFCEHHLPQSTVDILLENEEGSEYGAVYIGKRTGLSGGWRAFALDHKLDDGDALVFELIEPTRFKVYIVRAFDCGNQNDVDVPVSEAGSDAEEKPRETKKIKKSKNSIKFENEPPLQVSATRRSLRKR